MTEATSAARACAGRAAGDERLQGRRWEGNAGLGMEAKVCLDLLSSLEPWHHLRLAPGHWLAV